jgi:putative FmdB family regulatory protein
MPTYQYRCTQCGYEFEEFQSITDDPIEVCPACKGKTRRLISGGAGLIFKGSGFYATDYRDKSYKSAAEKEKSSSPPSGSSSPSRSGDSKPSAGKDS